MFHMHVSCKALTGAGAASSWINMDSVDLFGPCPHGLTWKANIGNVCHWKQMLPCCSGDFGGLEETWRFGGDCFTMSAYSLRQPVWMKYGTDLSMSGYQEMGSCNWPSPQTGGLLSIYPVSTSIGQRASTTCTIGTLTGAPKFAREQLCAKLAITTRLASMLKRHCCALNTGYALRPIDTTHHAHHGVYQMK